MPHPKITMLWKGISSFNREFSVILTSRYTRMKDMLLFKELIVKYVKEKINQECSLSMINVVTKVRTVCPGDREENGRLENTTTACYLHPFLKLLMEVLNYLCTNMAERLFLQLADPSPYTNVK